MNENIDDLIDIRAQLWGSLLLFIQYFFPKVTGRPFALSCPLGRESHFITLCRELTLVSRLQTLSLNINIAPGSGKSVMVSMFVAWCMSRWPDCQFIYVSYSKAIATKHTEFIKKIMECKAYKEIFNVHISHTSKAKEHFQTTAGGSIRAFGSAGSITGQDAGLPNLDRCSGGLIMDDMLKPDEAHSDSIRESIKKNYKETILQRPRGPNVFLVNISQRLHEDDPVAFFLSGEDERDWKHCILKSIDDAGNAMYPEVNSLEQLLEKKEKSPYVFSSQYQQEPIPAGGALYTREMFVLLDEEPKMIKTFITADTAETSKSYNDATVFSFWGLYEISDYGNATGRLALHWLNCWEQRIEPMELESSFLDFYGDCMHHPVKPRLAVIEKKSTGVTLLSVLQKLRGLEVRGVNRTSASGTKADRYIEMQPIIASKLISLPAGARHTEMCIKHMIKITANNAHAHDDICDTAYDAAKIALIDKTLHQVSKSSEQATRVMTNVATTMRRQQYLRNQRNG